MIHENDFVNLDDFNQYHKALSLKCLKNFKRYSMESSVFENEINDLENSIQEMHDYYKEIILKKIKIYLSQLKENAINNYLDEMKNVCLKKYDFKIP